MKQIIIISTILGLFHVSVQENPPIQKSRTSSVNTLQHASCLKNLKTQEPCASSFPTIIEPFISKIENSIYQSISQRAEIFNQFYDENSNIKTAQNCVDQFFLCLNQADAAKFPEQKELNEKYQKKLQFLTQGTQNVLLRTLSPILDQLVRNSLVYIAEPTGRNTMNMFNTILDYQKNQYLIDQRWQLISRTLNIRLNREIDQGVFTGQASFLTDISRLIDQLAEILNNKQVRLTLEQVLRDPRDDLMCNYYKAYAKALENYDVILEESRLKTCPTNNCQDYTQALKKDFCLEAFNKQKFSPFTQKPRSEFNQLMPFFQLSITTGQDNNGVAPVPTLTNPDAVLSYYNPNQEILIASAKTSFSTVGHINALAEKCINDAFEEIENLYFPERGTMPGFRAKCLTMLNNFKMNVNSLDRQYNNWQTFLFTCVAKEDASMEMTAKIKNDIQLFVDIYGSFMEKYIRYDLPLRVSGCEKMLGGKDDPWNLRLSSKKNGVLGVFILVLSLVVNFL